MGHDNGSRPTPLSRTVERCRQLTRSGDYAAVIREVERALPDLAGDDCARAELLIWEAQALLEMGRASQAVAVGRSSWKIRATPQACHLCATALAEQGRLDAAEELIHLGLEMFGPVPYLQIQLATLLIDQARHDEALTTIRSIDLDGPELDAGFAEFLWGMKADLLTALGRWSDAQTVLDEAQRRYPESDVLRVVEDLFRTARRREQARDRLATSWRRELTASGGRDDEVEESIPQTGAVVDLSELGILAARRLWRAFRDETSARPQAAVAWAAAVIAEAVELDGDRLASATLARKTGANRETIRGARRRLRAYLDRLDDELARRAFAAETNPRLEKLDPYPVGGRPAAGLVIPFPGTDTVGG